MDKRIFSVVITILIIFSQLFTNFAVATEFQPEELNKNIRKNVSLTFDVEGGTDIEKVLDILEAYQVKATFFLLGTWVERYPELAKRIVVEGHEIGNHSYNHPNLAKSSNQQIINNLQKAEKIIINATGASPKTFFRPPYGATNAKVLQAVGEAGYDYLCLWNIDPRDWDGKSARAITNQVLDNLHPGAIVLCHINKTNTPEALPKIIDGIIQRGYRVVPLSQQIGDSQKVIRQTHMSKMVESSKQNFRDVVEADFAVNGQVMKMKNGSRIISNRIFVSIRELAEILDGEVFWNSAEEKVTFCIGNQSFQFFINGDVVINDNIIADVPSAVLSNNISMVPLYIITRELGLSVSWEDSKKTANLIVKNYC